MIHLITQQWWHQKHFLFDHSLVRITVPVCHVQVGSTGVRALVWTVSGMRHWKRLIKISGDIDCYYYINNMPCLLHMYYCSVKHCYIPWYFFYHHVTCISCTSCGDTLFMYIYNLRSMCSLFHIYILRKHTIPVYSWYYSKIFIVTHWYRRVTIILSLNIMC